MKHLSPKTLEKKYAELGLSQDKIDLLHDYFLCFSNLYGVISVGDAWNVFREYEGIRLLHKKGLPCLFRYRAAGAWASVHRA